MFSCFSQYSHPYEFELERFQPPENQTASVEVQPFKPLNKTPLVFVSDVEALNTMLCELQKYKEIAIDLEVCVCTSEFCSSCMRVICTICFSITRTAPTKASHVSCS